MSKIKECQLYLITFGHKGIFWYKPGITTNPQVLEGRFKSEIKNGILINPKLITSTWFEGKQIAEDYEEQLQHEIIKNYSGYIAKDGKTRFHNRYLKEQIPGITEIRTYKKTELEYCINFINSVGYKKQEQKTLNNNKQNPYINQFFDL